ncbi:hypothetical protein TKK_0009765 [Trichogramma kaykai]
MGKKSRKRRHSSSSSEVDESHQLIAKQVWKVLKKKMKKMERKRSRSRSSSSSSYESTRSKQRSRSRSPTHREDPILLKEPDGADTARPGENQSDITTSAATEAPPKETAQTDEKELSENIMSVIGQRIIEKRTFAKPVHSSFAERWSDIMKIGLPKTERTELIKKYPTPKNCVFLDSPEMNQEIKLAVNEAARVRDQRIVEKQQKITASINGIAKTISTLVERANPEDISLIEALSDSARLITDISHDELSIRRSLVIANVNTPMRETLSSTEANKQLFGENLTEKLKQSKIVNQKIQCLTKKTSATTPKNFKSPLPPKTKKTTSSGQRQASSTTTYSKHNSSYRRDQSRSKQHKDSYSKNK